VKIPPQAALPGTQITDGIMTSWIDKKLLFAVREDLSYSYKVAATASTPQAEYQAKLRQFVRSLKVDEPVSGTLFAFVPPADAHEDTTPAGARPRNDLTGKEALAFDAVSIDGKSSFSLASLKGKPVLLDFWATWCGPCLKSQPALEKIYQDFKDKGFLVLGVDVGEKRDVVESFLKTHEMGYPVIVGSETAIPATYQATAFPTFVVIDANGTVAAHQIGFNNEATLRSLVSRVGLTAAASGNALTPAPGK
jgi:thiol-disulfide isomerase/thioredoxin